MDGVGGAGRGSDAGRASDCARAESAAKSAEKAAACTAEQAAAKKAEEAQAAVKPSPSLADYFKDAFSFAVQPGQRERALETTRQAPPGSVGAAINTPLALAHEALASKGLGGLCAGNVGDFYESQRPLLNSPATQENIERFSRLETENFAAQADCSKQLGGLMSAQTRADLINASAQVNEQLGDEVRQTVNLFTDPLRTIGDWFKSR
ncbi:hypothetical protein POL68_25105 [Stigmatella sp. ncwal1]|uniref:Uncharacterized protein n=1 Tax=Stigmatella ashevillensis TaxID=2995309 RepID=A0ABT5DDP2_9BACT|nr:hypothetical protein [Stigmatella ashevillena]MDC0711772.1 hypothetical protein [Stigmatella ashevillena]